MFSLVCFETTVTPNTIAVSWFIASIATIMIQLTSRLLVLCMSWNYNDRLTSTAVFSFSFVCLETTMIQLQSLFILSLLYVLKLQWSNFNRCFFVLCTSWNYNDRLFSIAVSSFSFPCLETTIITQIQSNSSRFVLWIAWNHTMIIHIQSPHLY